MEIFIKNTEQQQQQKTERKDDQENKTTLKYRLLLMRQAKIQKLENTLLAKLWENVLLYCDGINTKQYNPYREKCSII